MDYQPQPAEPAGVEATPNLIKRVILAFTAPADLGAVLRRTSPWFWALAIVAIVGAVIMLLVPAEVLQASLEAQARARPEGQEAPDPETMLVITRFGGAASLLVFTFIAAFVVAGALYLAFNVVHGQDSTYKQHLSATAHVWWIGLLGSFIVLPIWISTQDMQTKLGLGLLLQDAPETFVGYLLNNITLFGLWMGTALGAVESGLSGGRLTAGKGIGTVLALYLIWVVFQAAVSTLFGGFGA
ncbi:MAG: hypothetical protein PVG79_00485 [Gemmatimonadales bacterium]|jgi:hypothetical protein